MILLIFNLMVIEKYSLRWYHFLAAWFACLATGIVLQTMFMILVGGSGESFFFSLLTAVIALVISSPFIVLFCLIVHYFILKKERTRKQIHALVFMWHFIGSILVFIGLIIFANREMRGEGAGFVLLIMLGYFTVDSIYFVLFINKHTKSLQASEIFNEDLLDS